METRRPAHEQRKEARAIAGRLGWMVSFMNKERPFENHYCPCCLGSVDPVTGDHWHYCEYESSLGDWINPLRPLTEIEMLEEKLSRIKEKLKRNRRIERDLKARIKETNNWINRLEN